MSNIVVTPEFVRIESPPVMQAIIDHFLDHAHVVGHDGHGWPVLRFDFACAPWLMDKLAAFGAVVEDLEPEPVEDSID